MASKKKTILIYKIPIYFIVVVLAILFYRTLPELTGKYLNSKNAPAEVSDNSQVNPKDSPQISDWKTYNNAQYRFVIKTPPLLLERVYIDPEDYLFFVKFEENKFSKHKGVAVGVTDKQLVDEIENIKKQITVVTQVKPSESQIKIDGLEGVQLDYEKDNNLEARSVVVLRNKTYTFSISTTPEQIELVKSSIEFY